MPRFEQGDDRVHWEGPVRCRAGRSSSWLAYSDIAGATIRWAGRCSGGLPGWAVRPGGLLFLTECTEEDDGTEDAEVRAALFCFGCSVRDIGALAGERDGGIWSICGEPAAGLGPGDEPHTPYRLGTYRTAHDAWDRYRSTERVAGQWLPAAVGGESRWIGGNPMHRWTMNRPMRGDVLFHGARVAGSPWATGPSV